MRAGAWVVSVACSGAAVAITACPTPTGFQCSSDEDCRLDDRAGICVETEHCAYPDGECPSGLRYPPGAGTLGGMCVPGEMTPPSTDSAASDTGQSSTGDPTLFGGTTSPSATMGTSPPTSGATSAVEPSTGTPQCAPDDYPDRPEDAIPTETGGEPGDCDAQWHGMINDFLTDDLDFLVWEPNCGGGTFVMMDLGVADSVGLCAIPSCNRTEQACLTGTWDDEVKMCCRADDATLAVDASSGGDCIDGSIISWNILVRGMGCYAWGVAFSIG